MSELTIKKDELIKHSSAIHVSNVISIIERKISNILLKHSFPHLAYREKHSIYIKDIISSLGWSSYHNYELIKNSLKKLNTIQIEWNILKKDRKNEWGVTTMISGARIKNGICEYSYSPILRELLAIPNIYAKLNMAIQAKFNSKYSLALWEFAIEALCTANKDYLNTEFIEIKNIRKILGIDGVSTYEEFKILNRDVLKKAIDEINAISDINVECITKKNGKKVIALCFKITRKKDFDYPLLDLGIDSSQSEVALQETEQNKNNTLVDQLIQEFNFGTNKAHEIINSYSIDKIKQNIDYVRLQLKGNKIKNITAYFIASLKENWGLTKEKAMNQNENINDIGETFESQEPIWRDILHHLKNLYGLNMYNTWFSKLKFINHDIENEFIQLRASTEFYKDWIESNYNKDILKAAQAIVPLIKRVEIIF